MTSIVDIAPDWLDFIRAEEWGIEWRNPPVPERLNDPETYIHHSAGSRLGTDPVRAMQVLQRFSWSKNYSTSAYDAAVHLNTATNRVTICGIREGWRSAATKDRNELGEAIVLMGYFHPGSSRSEQPTWREIEALAWAVAWFIEQGWSARDTRALGHRDNPEHPNATACPGDYLHPHVPHIGRRALEILALAEQPTPTPDPEEDDVKSLLLWRDPRYAELFLIGNGPAINVSPEVRDHYMALGVPRLISEHDGMAETCRHQSGLDKLTPV